MRCRGNLLVMVGWLLAGWAGAQPSALPGDVPTLAFDAETQHYDASPGEHVAPFTFNVTNVWTNEIIIDRAHASCECTTAAMPSDPWHLAPGARGQLKVQVNLEGKMGLIHKNITFYYRLMPAGTSLVRVIDFEVNIPPPPAIMGAMSEAERQAAMTKALGDPQAIFKGDCARCHADRGRELVGQDLYAADCGICHESSHRDGKVPDLHALKQPTDYDFWKTMITLGKPHTMMPGFAATQAGPLTEAQIASLATYLDHTISHHLSPVAAGNR